MLSIRLPLQCVVLLMGYCSERKHIKRDENPKHPAEFIFVTGKKRPFFFSDQS